MRWLIPALAQEITTGRAICDSEGQLRRYASLCQKGEEDGEIEERQKSCLARPERFGSRRLERMPVLRAGYETGPNRSVRNQWVMT